MESDERQGAFGAALRWHRAAAGLSQEALAARSGLSVDAIGMLERGQRSTPRPSTVARLAAALRLPARDRAAFVASARPSEPARPPEPGAGIPPDPIAHFVGREPELAALQRLLDEGGRVAVHGLGGVGKTQLVVRFLHRRRGAYPDGVYWLRADRPTGLVGDLASLAWRLDLPEREVSEQERQVAAVLRWLREHPTAMALLKRSLAIGERVMGPDHVCNALTLSTMAIIGWRLGQSAAALPLAVRALVIAERSLPPGHRWRVESRRALAAITSAI